MNIEEQQYLRLIQKLFNQGHTETSRNGETISLFGESLRFSLKENIIPLITTKKVAWKTCLKELLWFISGKTDNTFLQKQGVHIWDANCTREFLDSRGLTDYKENELGPIYGYQWRNFNGQHIDQLQQVIDLLKNPDTRNSRRIILTAWNPCQLDEMSLPPCHIVCQFNVHNGNQLSCALYQRSCDIGLGACFNIASYSFLTHLLSKHCGLEAFEFYYTLGNYHIYKEHVEALQIQLERSPLPFPKVFIREKKTNIEDYTLDDFYVENYESCSAISMKMIA